MTDSFIEKPLLPENDISLCAVSEEATEVISSLHEKGIRVIKVKRASNLAPPISAHADIQILPLGGNLVAVNEVQSEVIRELESLDFEVLKVSDIRCDYPYDCRINVLPVKDFLVGYSSVIPSDILMKTGRKTLNVKQGYCRCSSILLNEDMLLTDDMSIGKGALNFVKYSFILKQNEISLPGYDHGFIGGSSGKLSQNTIAFCGRIPETSFGERLIDILSNNGFSFCELGNSPLTDIGGIVPLKQKRK